MTAEEVLTEVSVVGSARWPSAVLFGLAAADASKDAGTVPACIEVGPPGRVASVALSFSCTAACELISASVECFVTEVSVVGSEIKFVISSDLTEVSVVGPAEVSFSSSSQRTDVSVVGPGVALCTSSQLTDVSVVGPGVGLNISSDFTGLSVVGSVVMSGTTSELTEVSVVGPAAVGFGWTSQLTDVSVVGPWLMLGNIGEVAGCTSEGRDVSVVLLSELPDITVEDSVLVFDFLPSFDLWSSFSSDDSSL